MPAVVLSTEEDPPLAAGRHDLALSELNPAAFAQIRSAALPWLTSLDFCTMYEARAAQRAIVDVRADATIQKALFYREQSVSGVLRIVQVVGYPELDDAGIHELLAARRAHLAVAHRIDPPDAQRTSSPGGSFILPITHDVIADLPATKEVYLQSLGTQKRQQLPRYWRRLQREFDDRVTFQVQRGEQVCKDDILQLVRFNQSRMETLGKANTTLEEIQRQERRWPLTQRSGLLCTLKADGRLLGGTFNYLNGDEAFLIVIAHDPQLEHLNIGHLGLWQTFNWLIEQGGGIRRYHLFWGRKLYKNQFGGVDHPVSLWIVSRRHWLARVWTWRLAAGRQASRGRRFLTSRLARLLRR